MSSLIIKNIGRLYQVDDGTRQFVKGPEMAKLPYIDNAFIKTVHGIITDFGLMEKMPDATSDVFDAEGKMVLPAWCDSHTHIVYPAPRETEFIDKIKGLSYEEIARRGGGIINSAEKIKETSEDELFLSAQKRLEEMVLWGTGGVEIKSGYGLGTIEEIKMLRVIRRLKNENEVTIKSTFLGAHAIPLAYKNNRKKYIDILVNEMIPLVASEQLADFIDVFCDKGFFSPKETGKILEAASKYGLRPKIHANELGHTGGIETGIKYNALSVDHLEFTGKKEIKALKKSQTMPTILPGAAFFLGMKLAPARKMINKGLPVALATDYNPGSSPSGNMQLIISMGSILYRLLPEEVINAVTLNGAYAMGVEQELGSVAPGKRANLIILKHMSSIAYIPYSYGENKVDTMIINGKIVTNRNTESGYNHGL